MIPGRRADDLPKSGEDVIRVDPVAPHRFLDGDNATAASIHAEAVERGDCFGILRDDFVDRERSVELVDVRHDCSG